MHSLGDLWRIILHLISPQPPVFFHTFPCFSYARRSQGNWVYWCKAGRASLPCQKRLGTLQPGSPGFTHLVCPPGMPPWLSCNSFPSTLLLHREPSQLCAATTEKFIAANLLLSSAKLIIRLGKFRGWVDGYKGMLALQSMFCSYEETHKYHKWFGKQKELSSINELFVTKICDQL